jgi:hypothetical protein
MTRNIVIEGRAGGKEKQEIITTGCENKLNLNGVNQLIFVMVKCCVLFEVRTGFLNSI